MFLLRMFYRVYFESGNIFGGSVTQPQTQLRNKLPRLKNQRWFYEKIAIAKNCPFPSYHN